ncbi:Mur ligase family protein [Tundrisphaera sp. TA3]|uniref:Mur ligase family protein n=1 Tax=Tundrisphaera sp. TA3 TaxID=3435775 RepID=UPI003EBC546F
MTRWFIDRSPQSGIPSVSLRRLLPDAQFVGCRDWEVSGCTADTRHLDPGQVFVAVRGDQQDGHAYVGRALLHGAAGVVVERPCPEAGRLQVVVPDSRTAHGRICHALAGDPSARLRAVGVAGRRGKAAAAAFLRSIGEAHGETVGQVARSGWSDGAANHPIGPDGMAPHAVARMLATMVDRGCDGAVLEMDDAALERREFAGLDLDAAIVTRLGDRHPAGPGAIADRRRAAARLFRRVTAGGTTVIDVDDPDADPLGAVNLDARRVTFGLERRADVRGIIERFDPSGTRFRLLGFDREATVTLRLAGEDHVRHALAAAAVAWARGLPLRAVVDGLEAVDRIPGRLEPVRAAREWGLDVRVDQARTAPDLARSLGALRDAGAGRIICVVGAEGHGDRDGRLALARVAEAGADRVVLTSDNPRGEDPDRIFDDLLAGFRRPSRARVEPDRRQAIGLALDDARPGDAVLIAGKGRHAHQVLADRVVPFDDAEVAARHLAQHRHAPRAASA